MKRPRFTESFEKQSVHFKSSLPELFIHRQTTPHFAQASVDHGRGMSKEQRIVSLVQVDFESNFKRCEFVGTSLTLDEFLKSLQKVCGQNKIIALYALWSKDTQFIPVLVENDRQLQDYLSGTNSITDRLFRVSLSPSGSYFI